MIKHVVLAKVKPGTPQERIDAMVDGYNSMKAVIPELLSWSMGENVRTDSDYTHVMVAMVKDQESLDRYVQHPLHLQAAAELGRPIFESRVIADYEFDPQREAWRPLVQEVWTDLAEMVDPSHTALMVIDFQNDFCTPGGARMKGDLSTIESCQPPTARLVEAARAAGVPVVFTQSQTDAAHDTGPVFSRRARVGLKGASYTIPGTWGWEIADFLKPRPDETIIRKWHHSAFTNPETDAALRLLGAKTLVYTGIATNGCVEGAVRDAFVRGYYNVVLEDCCGAYDLDLQRYSLKNVATHFGLISNSEAVMEVWARVPAAV